MASESEASATTSTEVVPASSSTTSPETTSVPFTWNTDNETSTLASLFKVIVNVLTVSPSAAVTVTTSSLAPTSRSAPPSTLTVASASPATTSTTTEVTSHSKVSTSPSTTAAPLTVTTALALELTGTKITTLYSTVVSPSGAVTVTTSSFSPATRSVPPTTSKLDSDLTVSTTTSTEVVLSSVS